MQIYFSFYQNKEKQKIKVSSVDIFKKFTENFTENLDCISYTVLSYKHKRYNLEKNVAYTL